MPQTSVIGTFSFLLYVNDIQNAIKNSCVEIYSDATTLLSSCKQSDILASQDLLLFSYCKLTIIVDNCEEVFFWDQDAWNNNHIV